MFNEINVSLRGLRACPGQAFVSYSYSAAEASIIMRRRVGASGTWSQSAAEARGEHILKKIVLSYQQQRTA